MEGVLSNNLAEYDAVIMGDNKRKAEVVTHAAEWVWGEALLCNCCMMYLHCQKLSVRSTPYLVLCRPFST